MPSLLCLSIRFLDPAPTFHGRRDGGEPEWPPSPLRLFQALVAAAGARHSLDSASSALMWLEQQDAPTIITPTGVPASSGYRLSVPNNAMDVVAKAWCRGNDSNSGDADPRTHRTMKPVRSTYLLDSDAVHYLWSLPEPVSDEVRGHTNTLADVARSVVALGWGIDMVVGHGAIVSDKEGASMAGEPWLPKGGMADDGLRLPVAGTLGALMHRHARFLDRLGPGGFTAPPTFATYATVNYRRATDPMRRAVAAFSLLKPDASAFRAFDAARRALTVAGMMRHAAKAAAEGAGKSEEWINAFILGHGESKGGGSHVAVGPRRFAYLPLPSIEARGEGKDRVVGSVRRVIVTSFGEGCDAEITWARRALSGQELVDERTKEPVAIVSPIPSTDNVVRSYTEPAASWATVTPVVLPGYDDPAHYRRRLKQQPSAEEQKQLLARLGDRIDGLLRKAITQAGFSQVLATHADLEWRKVGFWPGADLADRYGVPDHLKRFPRFHVKLCWRDADGKSVRVPGPICIGGGRFFGLGLFAALGTEPR